MKHSALHLAVLASIGDKEGQMSLLSTAFSTDFGHFARSNNRANIETALLATGKSAKGKAIATAIAAGFKLGALVQGYVGAHTGKYASQQPHVQQPFEDGVLRACEAFSASLEAAEAFKNAVPKTDAEKVASKEAKEAKAEKAKSDILNGAVQDGTMVRASSMVVGQELTYTALVKMVIAGLSTASSDNLNALFGAVSAHVGMQAERDTLAEEAKQTRAADAQTRSKARLRDAASRSLAMGTQAEEVEWTQAKAEEAERVQAKAEEAQWAKAEQVLLAWEVRAKAEQATLAELAIEDAAQAPARAEDAKARGRDAQARALATADIARQLATAVAIGADAETLGISTAGKKTRGNKGRIHTVTLKAQQQAIADATLAVA